MLRAFILTACLLSARALYADVSSGPPANQAVEGFSIEVVTGTDSGKKIDPVVERQAQPTVYAFVPAERWSRPCARFLKKLDGEISSVPDAQVIAVWLTSDAAASKEYLPKAQQSLQFSRTDLSVFPESSSGPVAWGINTDADVTVVVVKDGKVSASFGFVSVNETVVDQVMKTLK